MVRRTIAAVFAVAALVAGPVVADAVVADAGAASAGPKRRAKVRVAVDPGTVRLVPGATAPVSVEVDFGTCVRDALVEIEAAEGEGYDFADVGEAVEGRARVSFALDDVELRGRWTVTATGTACATGRALARKKAFEVKRDTKVDGFAAEPGDAGVAVSGTLTRMDPWTRGYVPYARAKVRIESRTGDAGAWTTRDTVETDAQGRFSANVAADGADAWRAVFAGTRHHADAVGEPPDAALL